MLLSNNQLNLTPFFLPSADNSLRSLIVAAPILVITVNGGKTLALLIIALGFADNSQ